MRFFTLFFAVGVQQAFGSLPPPDWCQALGVNECAPEIGERSDAFMNPLQEELASRSAYNFLPATWAHHVEACRDRHIPLRRCGPTGPLFGQVVDIQFISEARARAARIGNAGGRLVIDCTGRHLQIALRGDLEQQIQTVRAVLEDLQTLLESETPPPARVYSQYHDLRAQSYTLGLGTRPRAEAPTMMFIQRHPNVPTHVQVRAALGAVPGAFIADRCIEIALDGVPVPAARQPAPVRPAPAQPAPAAPRTSPVRPSPAFPRVVRPAPATPSTDSRGI